MTKFGYLKIITRYTTHHLFLFCFKTPRFNNFTNFKVLNSLQISASIILQSYLIKKSFQIMIFFSLHSRWILFAFCEYLPELLIFFDKYFDIFWSVRFVLESGRKKYKDFATRQSQAWKAKVGFQRFIELEFHQEWLYGIAKKCWLDCYQETFRPTFRKDISWCIFASRTNKTTLPLLASSATWNAAVSSNNIPKLSFLNKPLPLKLFSRRRREGENYGTFFLDG
jgi:hypothetical protein